MSVGEGRSTCGCPEVGETDAGPHTEPIGPRDPVSLRRGRVGRERTERGRLRDGETEVDRQRQRQR